MKKIFTNSILTALLLLLLMPLFGQKHTYVPLAVEGAHWWVSFLNDNNPPWEPDDYFQYVIRGDSIINDIIYKKVFYRELDDQTSYITNEYLAGLVRDDQVYQKVYAIDINFPYTEEFTTCPKNIEFQLYDFSVDIGDTVISCLFGQSFVYQIDIEFYYGAERKIIDNAMIGIEGIGTEFGIFEWGFGSKGWSFYLSYYCLGTDEECGCQWVGIEEKQKAPPFRIYPNPVTGNIITLMPQIPVSEPVEVRLYDMNGREIYRQAFDRLTEKLTLQIPDFRSAPSSPLLLWVGNSQSTLHKQLVIRF